MRKQQTQDQRAALQRIIAAQTKATKHLDVAIRRLDQIQKLMAEGGIEEIRGIEVHKLSQSFLKLCTKVATANPATSKSAFEALRTGEWRL